MDVKKIAMICGFALFALVLAASSVTAQEDTTFCAIPEGCDLDGDGNPDVPAGTPAPPEDQYTDEALPVAPPVTNTPTAPSVPAQATPEDNGQSPVSDTPVPAPVNSEGEERGISSPDAAASTDSGSSSSASVQEPDSGDYSKTLTVLPDTGGSTMPILVGILSLTLGAALMHRILR